MNLTEFENTLDTRLSILMRKCEAIKDRLFPDKDEEAIAKENAGDYHLTFLTRQLEKLCRCQKICLSIHDFVCNRPMAESARESVDDKSMLFCNIDQIQERIADIYAMLRDIGDSLFGVERDYPKVEQSATYAGRIGDVMLTLDACFEISQSIMDFLGIDVEEKA